MADPDISSKPVSKCQSCGEISTIAPAEHPKVIKYCKSHSVTELGSLKVTSKGSTTATIGNVHPPVDKISTEELEGDAVLCDYCLEGKVRAVKTCLTCMVNYCTTHLRPHLDNPKLHSHQLVPPMNDTEFRTCAVHNRPLEMFCKSDLICICQECAEGEHKDHQPIPCAEARKQVEAEVQQIVSQYDWKLKSAENAIVKLEANTTSIQNSVIEARKSIDLQFEELQEAVKKAHSKVLEFLDQREKAAINQSVGIKTHMEQKCNDLKKTKAKVEGIAKHKSEFCFLQEYCEFKKSTGDDTIPSVYIGLKDKLSGIKKVVTESTEKFIQQLLTSYTDKLQEFAKEEEILIKNVVSAIVPASHRISAPEPSTREEFLKYKSIVTLDPATAHCFLRLLQNNRKVSNSSPWQQAYPDLPERFENVHQVLSAESFYMSRHYFEAEFKGEAFHIGVTYKCIDRKGAESNSTITGNDFSWTLKWNGKEFSAWHKDVAISIISGKFSRIGVYIDHQRGTVAFYGVTDVMTLLHKFEGTFAEPLYAAIWLPKKENSVTIIEPDDMAQPVAAVSPSEANVPTTTSEKTITSNTKTEVTISTTVQTIKVKKSTTDASTVSSDGKPNNQIMLESEQRLTKITTM
ncbi:PREDICTED: tripartite motif-containing protein 16 [Nanorana parkeri]|uniref:tripartite motif-containing protein 16 n=1 Tax=Nanorana parkeri TaxID=125878 RepID=UPI0008547402|nr:PREDICTED: tripartite motif-containing protein 16 [Nanorana parkeri]